MPTDSRIYESLVNPFRFKFTGKCCRLVCVKEKVTRSHSDTAGATTDSC